MRADEFTKAKQEQQVVEVVPAIAAAVGRVGASMGTAAAKAGMKVATAGMKTGANLAKDQPIPAKGDPPSGSESEHDSEPRAQPKQPYHGY